MAGTSSGTPPGDRQAHWNPTSMGGLSGISRGARRGGYSDKWDKDNKAGDAMPFIFLVGAAVVSGAYARYVRGRSLIYWTLYTFLTGVALDAVLAFSHLPPHASVGEQFWQWTVIYTGALIAASIAVSYIRPKIRCPQCATRIDAQAIICPHCHHQQQNHPV